MKIAGLHKCSTVDYPGRLAAVVFTPGCNMRCGFCHNAALLADPDAPGTQHWDPADVLALLARRRKLLDGVVISGGEPTLQPRLVEFVRPLRALGFQVKLDTNGTRPGVVRALLEAGLLDYVAMDIKAPPERYAEVCAAPVDLAAVNQTVRLLRSAQVPVEFRTTLAPGLTLQDIEAMARWIAGAQRYVVQQYRPPGAVAADAAPEFVRRAVEVARPWVVLCEARGLGPELSVAPVDPAPRPATSAAEAA